VLNDKVFPSIREENMPPPMIHLLVARQYSEEFPELEMNPEFYLGNIAPDAVYTRSDYSSILKDISHLNNWKANQKENVFEFYSKSNKSPYILGYCLHILTDIITGDIFRLKFNEKEIPTNLRESIYHKEIQLFSQSLYSDSEFSKYVFSMLDQSHPYSVDELVTQVDVQKEKEYVTTRKAVRSQIYEYPNCFSIPELYEISNKISRKLLLEICL
jgi:hypothetical protein